MGSELCDSNGTSISWVMTASLLDARRPAGAYFVEVVVKVVEFGA
jgi:hypothetical protein